MLSKSSFSKLYKECRGSKGDSIDYKHALKKISVNMEVDTPLMKEWVVRADGDAGNKSMIASSVARSVVPS